VKVVTSFRVNAAELLGSFLLTLVVIGSGIAAQQLSPGQLGLELLENAAVTCAGLYVLIQLFAPVSGAHFNPAVSVANVFLGDFPLTRLLSYIPMQVLGCVLGAWTANAMFSLPTFEVSTHHRATVAHGVSEVVATAGLLLVIFGLVRLGRTKKIAGAVASYIGAAYFFTSSTSFANPAITIGRAFSNSFAGIAPSSVPLFIGAQLVGTVIAIVVVKVLYPKESGDRS